MTLVKTASRKRNLDDGRQMRKCSNEILTSGPRNCCTSFSPRKCTCNPTWDFGNWMGSSNEQCKTCECQQQNVGMRKSCPDMVCSAPFPCFHQPTGCDHQHSCWRGANACRGRRVRSDVVADKLRPTQSSGLLGQRQFLQNASGIRGTYMSNTNLPHTCPGVSGSAREVTLYGWFLTKVQSGNSSSGNQSVPSVAVGGYKTPQMSTTDLVQTGRVELRLERSKVRTVDGMEICLMGMIDLRKSVENGFPPTLVQFFLMGFPSAWIYMMMTLPTVTKSGSAIKYPWMSDLAAPSEVASPFKDPSQGSIGENREPTPESLATNDANGPSLFLAPKQGLCTDSSGATGPVDEGQATLSADQQSKLDAFQALKLKDGFLAHATGEELHHRMSLGATACLYPKKSDSGVQNISTISENHSQVPRSRISTDYHLSGNVVAIKENGQMINQAQTLPTSVDNVDKAFVAGTMTGNANCSTETCVINNVLERVHLVHFKESFQDDGICDQYPVNSVIVNHSRKVTLPINAPESASSGGIYLDGLEPGSQAVEADVPDCGHAFFDTNMDLLSSGVVHGSADGQRAGDLKDASLEGEDLVMIDRGSSDPILQLMESDKGMNRLLTSAEASGVEDAPSPQGVGNSMKLRSRRNLSYVESSVKKLVDIPDLHRGKETRIKRSRSKQTALGVGGDLPIKDVKATGEEISVAGGEDHTDFQVLVPSTPVQKSRKRKCGDGSPSDTHLSSRETDLDPSERLENSGQERTLRSGKRLPVVNEPHRYRSAGRRNAYKDTKILGAIDKPAVTQVELDIVELMVPQAPVVSIYQIGTVHLCNHTAHGTAQVEEMEGNVDNAIQDAATICCASALPTTPQIKKRRRKGNKFYKSKRSSSKSSGLDLNGAFNCPHHPTRTAQDVRSREVKSILSQPEEMGEQIAVPSTALTEAEDNVQTETGGHYCRGEEARKKADSTKRWQAKDRAHEGQQGHHQIGRGERKEKRKQTAKPKVQCGKFIIPPPLPTPRVLDKSQVTQAYGLKMSRHGRILVPPLAVWCNQSIKYDTDGSIIAISAGSRSESEYSTVSYDLPSDKTAKLLQKKYLKAADRAWLRK